MENNNNLYEEPAHHDFDDIDTELELNTYIQHIIGLGQKEDPVPYNTLSEELPSSEKWKIVEDLLTLEDEGFIERTNLENKKELPHYKLTDEAETWIYEELDIKNSYKTSLAQTLPEL